MSVYLTLTWLSKDEIPRSYLKSKNDKLIGYLCNGCTTVVFKVWPK